MIFYNKIRLLGALMINFHKLNKDSLHNKIREIIIMQLTLYTDYSLRVLVYLSLNQQRSATISEIAEFYQISRNHLVKVVHNLSLKKYINSSRGKGGGLRLSREPELINIGAVVRDTEPNFHVVECFNSDVKNACSVEPICNLKGIVHQATSAFLNTLDSFSVADILNDSSDATSIVQLDPHLKRILQETEES